MNPLSNQSGGQQGAQGTQGAAGGQQQDYGDKAFDLLAKKSGHNVDQNTGEKITDGARNLFEKTTGKKVNPKISN
ncbi:hypothetical protein VTK73DRAFT_2657 [Phialemonium thermophilum]|uniref:Uncharacterized protein n=1 Tax=Phialemonium thermophilum TaxID=223376 RepID=A0ABR3VQ89_9PEZI